MPRKSHRKSRSGCSICEYRRIKVRPSLVILHLLSSSKDGCPVSLSLLSDCTLFPGAMSKSQTARYPSRDEKCSYLLPTDLVWVEKRTSSARNLEPRRAQELPFSYTSSPQEGALNGKDPSLNLDNIELIIHWFTTIVHTVNPPSAVPKPSS